MNTTIMMAAVLLVATGAAAAGREAEMKAPRPIDAVKPIEMGKKIVELRTRLPVEAIQKAMAASKTSQQD